MLLLDCTARVLIYKSYGSVVRYIALGIARQRRCFATNTSRATNKGFRRVLRPRPESVNLYVDKKAATWLAPDPSNVQPSDVLEQLQNLNYCPGLNLEAIVFLATPSFTHWFDKDNEFLSKAVQQLLSVPAYGSSDDFSTKTIRTISTIVDRIPSDTKLTSRIFDSGVGYEGISLLFSKTAIRSQQAESRVTEDEPQKAHVRFVSYIGKTNEQQIVGLPVANTLFRNGNHSTSFEDTWELVGHHEKRECFRRSSRVRVQSFDIETKSLRKLFFLGIPLVPLTSPQEISSSMGNVIRELRQSDSGAIVPASTDLEAAVPKLLQSRWLTDTARKTFSVFALTARKGWYDGANSLLLLGIHPPKRLQLFKSLLDGDVRMLRVTGGGGGWGNKKGLLSLEPGVDILGSGHKHQQAPPQGDEDYDFKGTSALVSPGDDMQFFAVFPGPQEAPRDEPVPEARTQSYLKDEAARLEASRGDLPRVVIGTNPPEDQYPTTIPEIHPSADKLLFVPNFFGMLSEGGLCLGRTKKTDVPGDNLVTFMSRLDIPYTTVVTEMARGDGISSHVVRRTVSNKTVRTSTQSKSQVNRGEKASD